MSQLKAIVDKLLTGVSSAYIPEGYISEEVLPFIGSKQSTGLLAKYGNQHLRIENSYKAGRGSYRRVEAISRSSVGYAIEGHGLEDIVTKEDYANVENPYKPEEDCVMGLQAMLWLEKEKLLADTLADTSVVTQTQTLSGTSQFSDYDNSDPLSIFKTARSTVRTGCGKYPNGAIMDMAVWNVLRFHPQVLDALGFKYARPGGLEPDELAVALGVKKIFLADASYNTVKEGQTDSIGAVWGKHIIFGVFPDKAVPYQVSLGYRIGYENEAPRKVYKQANFNPPGSTLVLCEDNYDFLISNTGAAYSIKSAIA